MRIDISKVTRKNPVARRIASLVWWILLFILACGNNIFRLISGYASKDSWTSLLILPVIFGLIVAVSAKKLVDEIRLQKMQFSSKEDEYEDEFSEDIAEENDDDAEDELEEDINGID